MSKGQWAFRPAALISAIKAAEKAGKDVVGAEIDPVTRKILLKFHQSGASRAETVNEWDGRRMTRIKLDYVHQYRDRHGKLRRYFRRPGFKRIALPGLPGSDEFMTAYQLALAGQSPHKEIGVGRTRPGTVNGAIVGYYSSIAFRSLAVGTQKLQRSILERFRAQSEPCGGPCVGMIDLLWREHANVSRTPMAVGEPLWLPRFGCSSRLLWQRPQ